MCVYCDAGHDSNTTGLGYLGPRHGKATVRAGFPGGAIQTTREPNLALWNRPDPESASVPASVACFV